MLLLSSGGSAYNNYSNSQCENCHSTFGGFGEALHDMHLTFITGNCDMCHPNGGGSKPVNTSSAGDPTAFSCAGCHGRDYGGSDGVLSVGLRDFHIDQRGQSCSPCHDSDPSPALGENVNPPHYGRSDVSLTIACSDNLDNDGDGVRDGSDPECQVPVENTTWGRLKALYTD